MMTLASSVYMGRAVDGNMVVIILFIPSVSSPRLRMTTVLSACGKRAT